MRMYLLLINSGKGTSGNKCFDIYRGPQPFSEVEMRNIRDYVLNLDPVPILSTSVHSCGELYLWPYGYDFNKYPDNYEEIVSLSLNFKYLIEILIVIKYISFLVERFGRRGCFSFELSSWIILCSYKFCKSL